VSPGSALYVPELPAKNGWSVLFPTNVLGSNFGLGDPVVDFNITKLKVTADKNDNYDSNNIQYVLWTIKDPLKSFVIWTSPLNPSNLLANVQGYNFHY
jgi:hypothetical protein